MVVGLVSTPGWWGWLVPAGRWVGGTNQPTMGWQAAWQQPASKQAAANVQLDSGSHTAAESGR